MLLMLDNLRICDKDKYGAKAATLGELISKKILNGKFSIEMEEELYYFFSQIKDVNFKLL